MFCFIEMHGAECTKTNVSVTVTSVVKGMVVHIHGHRQYLLLSCFVIVDDIDVGQHKKQVRISSRNSLKDCARHHPISHWILWSSGDSRVESEASSGYLPAVTGVVNILRTAVPYCSIWLKISTLLICGMNASDYHYRDGFH